MHTFRSSGLIAFVVMKKFKFVDQISPPVLCVYRKTIVSASLSIYRKVQVKVKLSSHRIVSASILKAKANPTLF